MYIYIYIIIYIYIYIYICIIYVTGFQKIALLVKAIKVLFLMSDNSIVCDC